MANSPLIKSTPEEGLVVLTLNRPECRNALSFELSELLLQHVLELEHDKSTRVVILQGNGKTFCSGLDLKQALSSGFTVVNNERIPLGKQMPTLILEILSRLLSLPQILISAAQGYACGGGAALIAISDFVIAEENFQLSFPEVSHGLYPALLYPILQRKLSVHVLKELILTGQFVSAEQLQSFGMIHKTVAEGASFSAAVSLARKLLANDSESLFFAKKMSAPDLPSADELKNAVELHWISWNRPVTQDRIRKFFKRH